jgi:hypothetical protein
MTFFTFACIAGFRLTMINFLSHRLGFTAHALGDFGLSRRMPAVLIVVFHMSSSQIRCAVFRVLPQ